MAITTTMARKADTLETMKRNLAMKRLVRTKNVIVAVIIAIARHK
jgi:hypothetical protein